MEHGRHGLLVPAGDAEALAAALDEALGRTWDTAALRERVRRYSWTAVVEEQERVYAEASLRPARPAAPAPGA